jgi:alpha-L-fucosidase 2
MHRRRALASVFAVVGLAVQLAGALGDDPRLPGENLDLVLAAPIRTWDEALPLGNGLLGGLLWGDGNTLRLSLDRGDLWDERPRDGMPWKDFNYRTMIRLVAENKNAELNKIFDYPYGGAHPSKIPAGRLEIVLGGGRQLKEFRLCLASAEARLQLSDKTRITAFFHAGGRVALVRIPGYWPAQIRLRAPESLKNLGYPPAEIGAEGPTQWFLQTAAMGLRYCVAVGESHDGRATTLAVTVTSTRDGRDPLDMAKQRIAKALRAGYEKPLAEHQAWWRQFWSASRLSVPELDILRHYYLVQYFYGAASRRGAPPMPLQGVWTADAGGLPPWKGDYHNDLNTQMTYIAYQAAGHFDEGRSFLDYLWDLLPGFRKFAQEFYNAPGAAVPGVMSLAGQPLGGWGHYSLSPTMGAWNAHLFYLHWRYTGDEQFLRQRAYPWCREIGLCLRHLLKRDAEGRLKLPLSTSPEIFGNTARAWLTPNSNYDLACLKMLFLALAEMAQACAEPGADEWREAARQLGPFHVNSQRVLKLDAKLDLGESHRHLSNLIAIHPFNLITVEGAGQRELIAASLADWDRLGTSAWCGYSFSWMSCLRARVGDAEAALRNLDVYVKAFILRNGFHANGDQTRSGFSSFHYRPFTLEGNFLAAQAVQEMLLQGWSVQPGTGEPGVIRIFPAVPWRWHAASFDDLRAEGGHRVSARREQGATTWVRIVAGQDGMVSIADNFGGRSPAWSRPDVQRSEGRFTVRLKRGETLEAHLPCPDRLGAPPADQAAPVVISKPAVR